MKITTTRELLIASEPYSLEWFDTAYPNIDKDQEVSLKYMLLNGYNTVDDVLWILFVGATKQDGSSVYEEVTKRHMARKSKMLIEYTKQLDRNLIGTFWVEDLEKQKQDLLELLS
jgi:hypothetical protein